jgi:hypothetical protein
MPFLQFPLYFRDMLNIRFFDACVVHKLYIRRNSGNFPREQKPVAFCNGVSKGLLSSRNFKYFCVCVFVYLCKT